MEFQGNECRHSQSILKLQFLVSVDVENISLGFKENESWLGTGIALDISMKISQFGNISPFLTSKGPHVKHLHTHTHTLTHMIYEIIIYFHSYLDSYFNSYLIALLPGLYYNFLSLGHFGRLFKRNLQKRQVNCHILYILYIVPGKYHPKIVFSENAALRLTAAITEISIILLYCTLVTHANIITEN